MTKSKNPIIEDAKKKNHVANWELGEKMGCHENTIIRMLRHPLTDEQTSYMVNIIDEIVKEREP